MGRKIEQLPYSVGGALRFSSSCAPIARGDVGESGGGVAHASYPKLRATVGVMIPATSIGVGEPELGHRSHDMPSTCCGLPEIGRQLCSVRSSGAAPSSSGKASPQTIA